jgi:hypothetical protein
MKKETKAIFVGGTFDEDGGKESSLAKIMFLSMSSRGLTTGEFLFINGGKYEDLKTALEDVIPEVDYVFWFANIVNNNMPKIVNRIKAVNKTCILVTSKRNYITEESKSTYSFPDLIQHALKNKSNLLVEFSGKPSARFSGTVYDPLGNIICDKTDNFVHLSKSIVDRVKYLKTITRVGSINVGEALEIPDEKEFFEFIKSSAERFSDLIPTPTENHRFLGNASFRCSRGFPSFKKDGIIYVSRRNVDKEHIGKG